MGKKEKPIPNHSIFSPSPNPQGGQQQQPGYPVRSPAPNGGPGRVTPGPQPGAPPPGANFGMPGVPPGAGGPGPQQMGHFSQFPANPQPNNSQTHVQKLLGNVNQQPIGGRNMANPMGQMPPNMRPPHIMMQQPGAMYGMNMNPNMNPQIRGPMGGPGMNQYVPRQNQPNQVNNPNMNNQPGQPHQQQQQQAQQQQPGVANQNPQMNPVNPQQQPQQQAQPQGGPGIGASDPDKRKMIQNQLIILIHAAKCQKRTDPTGSGDAPQCNIPHCQTMKNVLLHLPNCQMGRNCTIQHCASSRQIIAHWKQCKRPDCAVCQPLKPPVNNPGGAANQQNPNQGGAEQQALHQANPNQQGPDQTNRPNPGDQQNQTGNQPNVGTPSQNPASRPGQPGQATGGGVGLGNQPDWRAEVNQELREHLVKKLVSAIFPTTDSNERNSNDDRIKKLYNFARKVSIERLKQEL